MVVIARFVDERRARRIRAWLHRSHIATRLELGMEGQLELAVHARDEHRAMDLMLTLVWGLEIDHMRPERRWQRAMTLENAMLGGAVALVAAMVALLGWWVIPVLAVVPIGTIGLIIGVVFLVVAAYPGRTALARDPFSRHR